MTISIITATYNAEKTLETAIQSVINQTYPHIEYIIIDGGSTDNTLQIIEKYKPFISHLISEKDNGIYDALNKGIDLAKGDIVGVLHADDIFYDDYSIETIAKAFHKNDVDAVYGDLEYVQSTDVSKIVRYWQSKPFKKHLLKFGWMPPHPTLYVKNEVFKKIGAFNLQYKISADYDFILRLFSNTKYSFAYLPIVITKMRLGGASNKSINNIILKSKEDLNALRSNKVGGMISLFFKNISKLPQFIKR